MEARIAWFVMAHHKPEQLGWIVDALARGSTSNELILLHVDLKSRLGLKPERNGIWRKAQQLATQYPNVRLMRSRFTNWGGWSLSQLHLDAIDTALRLDGDWSHFVNLSGQCYPITTLADVRSRLGRADGKIFIELRHFSTLPADDWHLAGYSMIELPHKAIKRLAKRHPPVDIEVEYKGSQWSILPRAFCEWQREAAIAQRIREHLRGLLLSDELIMQTLVRNGPWRDRVAAHYGREIVWPGPKVFTSEDLPYLLDSPGFFARKFDLAQDPTVLHALAERLQLPTPQPLFSLAAS
jgi:hypothetical protein